MTKNIVQLMEFLHLKTLPEIYFLVLKTLLLNLEELFLLKLSQELEHSELDLNLLLLIALPRFMFVNQPGEIIIKS